MSDVSVVIPVRNAGPSFAATLGGVRSQAGVGAVDLVVLDSESGDQTVPLARAAGARVRRVNRHTFNHGATRNLGAALARGEFIAFLTQDAEPVDGDWLAALVSSIREHRAAGAYSRVLPRPGCSPLVERCVRADLVHSPERQVKRISAEDYDALAPFDQRVYCHFNNVSSMVWRPLFEKMPFPEFPFGEDLAWGAAMLRAGQTLVYEPRSRVYHSHESRLLGDFRRHREDAQLMKTLFGIRNRDSWRDSLAAVVREVALDWRWLFRQRGPLPSTLGLALYSPCLRAAQIAGQLAGSRLAVQAPPRFAGELPGVERAPARSVPPASTTLPAESIAAEHDIGAR